VGKTSLKPKRSPRGSRRLQRILKSGKKCEKNCFAVYWSKDVESPPLEKKKQLFLIVGKRALRLAHERNRAKRLIREIYRKTLKAQNTQVGIAIRVVRRPPALTTQFFRETLEPLLRKVES